MADHIDLNISDVIERMKRFSAWGRTLQELIHVASGTRLKDGIFSYVNSADIFMLGPVN